MPTCKGCNRDDHLRFSFYGGTCVGNRKAVITGIFGVVPYRIKRLIATVPPSAV